MRSKRVIFDRLIGLTQLPFFSYHKNMSKILLVLLSFFVIAAFPANSFAQEDVITMSEDVTNTPTSNTTRTLPNNPRTPGSRIQTQAQTMEAKNVITQQISEARMEFKEKLQEISDKAKQAVLERIVNKINENNAFKTKQLSERLDRLTEILSKISKMAADLEEQGAVVTTLNNQITKANSAIEDAKESVATQMEKEYIIDITTEQALRTNARSTIQKYVADMKAVLQDVLIAHRAVVQASSTAKALSETISNNKEEVLE